MLSYLEDAYLRVGTCMFLALLFVYFLANLTCLSTDITLLYCTPPHASPYHCTHTHTHTLHLHPDVWYPPSTSWTSIQWRVGGQYHPILFGFITIQRVLYSVHDSVLVALPSYRPTPTPCVAALLPLFLSSRAIDGFDEDTCDTEWCECRRQRMCVCVCVCMCVCV